MPICLGCGQDNKSEARFCRGCGKQLQAGGRKSGLVIALSLIAVAVAVLAVVLAVTVRRHEGKPGGDPVASYRQVINQLLYDQDTLESHINSVATWSHNDRDAYGQKYTDEQALRDMTVLLPNQRGLLDRAQALTAPVEYVTFHQSLLANLQQGNERIDLWLQAMADQLHYSYNHAQRIWVREVKVRDGYKDDMDALRSRRPR